MLNTRIGNYLYIVYISLAVIKQRVVRPGHCTSVYVRPVSLLKEINVLNYKTTGPPAKESYIRLLEKTFDTGTVT